MLWHLISSDCPLTMHASVSILTAPQIIGLKCPLLHKAEAEVSLNLLLPACLSPLVDMVSGVGFRSTYSNPITHVIRSGCHGNRQCSSSIQVGLFCAWTIPSVFMHSICAAQARRERDFTISIAPSFGWETLNESYPYSSKGDQQAVLAGCSM